MSRPLSLVYSSLCLLALCMVFMISSCGNGVETSGGAAAPVVPVVPVTTANTTGSVAFQLFWQQPPVSDAEALFTPSFNSCVDHSISTISATVTDGTTTVASASWPCAAHEGLIITVPTGTNLTVTVTGRLSGSTIWSGIVSPVTVNTAQITNVGTIVMNYVGLDTTKPTVISIGPYSNPSITTNVPVTDRFTIVFDKPMAISTLTTTAITLKKIDNTPVPGVVSYVTASNAAVFTPSATLPYNTQHTLRVISCVTPTTCITDTAGNSLAFDYADTSSTESAPTPTVPGAPSAVTATAGNGQVTLDWRASNRAESYNVYYSNSSGVTTTTGIKGTNVRATFVHLGLPNDVTKYYIVTAVSGTYESPSSAQVSATPVFSSGNPLPPAFISISSIIGQNSITWPAVSGATSYNLYWSTSPIIPDKYSADNVVRNVTSPYTHTGLSDTITYCYIVTALNSNGESANSRQTCVGIGSIFFNW